MKHSQIQTHLWGRLFDRPHFVLPARAAELAAYLTGRAGLQGVITGPDLAGVSLAEIQAASAERYSACRGGEDRYCGEYATFEGVAIIPVVGTLVQRLGCMSWSGMVGYDAIKAEIVAALEDDNVGGILLEEDTPGGECSGLFDLCDFIRAAGAVKPIWAHANELAASAGYAIASQASVVTTTQSGRVGSIGAVWMHTNVAGMLEKQGCVVTLVHSGAHKVDGNPFGALPPEVLADFQSELDEARQMFAEKVNLGRPSLSLDAILATEARVYGPGDALSLGLIDGVMSLDEAISAFASQLAGSTPAAISSKGATMSKTKTGPSGPAMLAGLRAAGVLPRAKAETPEDEKPEAETEDETEAALPEDGEDDETEDEGDGDPEGDPEDDPPEDEDPPKPSARKSAATAERKRIAAIIGAPEAKGRETLASHLAFNTGSSAAAARAILKASPKSAQATGFAATMASAENPVVGAGAPPQATASVSLLQRGAALAFGAPKKDRQ